MLPHESRLNAFLSWPGQQQQWLMPHLSEGGHNLGLVRGAKGQVCKRHLANNKHLLGNYGVAKHCAGRQPCMLPAPYEEQATCSSGLQMRNAAVLTGGAAAPGPYPPRHHCARPVQLLQPSRLGLLPKGETKAGRGAKACSKAPLRTGPGLVPATPSKPARPVLAAAGSAPSASPLDDPPPSPRRIGSFHLSVRRASGFSSSPPPPWGKGAPCAAPIGCACVRLVPAAANQRQGAEPPTSGRAPVLARLPATASLR